MFSGYVKSLPTRGGVTFCYRYRHTSEIYIYCPLDVIRLNYFLLNTEKGLTSHDTDLRHIYICVDMCRCICTARDHWAGLRAAARWRRPRPVVALGQEA